jgi:Putative adhesin
MFKIHSQPHLPASSRRVARATLRALVACAALALLSLWPAADARAQQQHYARSFAPRQNVSLLLKNRMGLIEVQGWERNEIRVTATMESPAAHIMPTMSDDGLTIDVAGDNRGRDDMGDVNFKIQVPYDSTVDLQTARGDIKVRNVRGRLVHAHVFSEGDIELTDIRAQMVIAENVSGDILFDAELLRGGSYELKSTQGDINMRIMPGSGFTLIATAPRTRNINLGGFANMGNFNFQGDSRRVVGTVGDGSARIITTNLRGAIKFAQR